AASGRIHRRCGPGCRSFCLVKPLQRTGIRPRLFASFDSEHRYGVGQFRPTWVHPAGPSSPRLNYKWERTEKALRQLATSSASPVDDVALEYINPHTGGPVLPTI